MNESDKKLITERLLGECWHDAPYNVPKTDIVYRCVKCKTAVYPASGFRTFTDPQDFFACFEKLVELGEWEKFKWFFIEKFKEQLLDIRTSMLCPYQWLNSRTESGHYRLCVLCAEWLKEAKDEPK
jgi:hypothetical protein